MILLTTYSQFVGTINIPNPEPSTPEGSELAGYILEFEPKFLAQLLGNPLFDLIQAALVAPAATSGDIYDLINGKEFTDSNGRLNKWPGFRQVGNNPIAYYVYYQIIRDRESTSMGIGEKKAKGQNSIDASSSWKQKRAWNHMVQLNGILDEYLTVNASKYPDYLGRYGSASYGNESLFTQISNFF